MTSLLSEMGRAVQDRNRKLAECFRCECFVTCRGVLCQGTGSCNAKIGDRLVIEVENGSDGPCVVYAYHLLMLLLAELPREKRRFCSPCFVTQYLCWVIGKDVCQFVQTATFDV